MNRRLFWRLYGAHLAAALGLILAKELLDWAFRAKTFDGPVPMLAFGVVLTCGINRAVREGLIAGAMDRSPPADWTEPEVRELHRRLLVVSTRVLLASLVIVVVPITYLQTRDARTTAVVVGIYLFLSIFIVWHVRSGGAETIAQLRGQ